jgi:hypothetical protein
MVGLPHLAIGPLIGIDSVHRLSASASTVVRVALAYRVSSVGCPRCSRYRRAFSGWDKWPTRLLCGRDGACRVPYYLSLDIDGASIGDEASPN